MNLQDVSHIHIPDGDVRMIHDSDNRLLWGAVGYNVLFSGNTYQQTYTGKNLLGLKKPSSNTFGFEPVVAEESGTITVNGTFTGGGGGFPWISDRQLSIPAGTYTFSMKNPQSFNVSLRMFDAQGQYTSGKYIAAGATSGTFTLEYDCVRVAILIGAFSAGKTLNNQKFEELQLEAGSTATSFEPFVGGQPSPNPDYPQQIQTVTGEQTVTVTGKNLFNSSVYVSVQGYNAQRTLGNDGSITWVNTTSDSYFPWIYSDSMFGNNAIRSATIPVQPSTQYTVSLKKTTATAIGLYIYEGDSDYVGIKNTYTTIRGDASYTFTTSETTRYVILRFAKWASQETDVLSEIQLEAGSTATSYEPYSKQTLPINLGTIELCKLGTYQDYIWKDGDDWKVHKATKKISIIGGFTKWTSSGVDGYYNNTLVQDARQAIGEKLYVSPQYGAIPIINGSMIDFNDYVVSNNIEYGIGVKLQSVGLAIRDKRYTTAQGLNDWLAENPVTLYYALALSQAYDTTITDTNLIAQLDSLVNGGAEDGTTYIKVNATDPNLPGLLYVEAPKYE